MGCDPGTSAQLFLQSSRYMAWSPPLKCVSRISLPVPGSTHWDRTQQDHGEAGALLYSCPISPQPCPSVLPHVSSLSGGAPVLHHQGFKTDPFLGPTLFCWRFRLFSSLLFPFLTVLTGQGISMLCEFFINSNRMSPSMIWRTKGHFPQRSHHAAQAIHVTTK